MMLSLTIFILFAWSAVIAPIVALGPQAPSVRPAAGVTTYHPSTPGQLDGGDFMSWVTTQAGSGVRTLAIAKGAYHVQPGSQYAHIFLSSLTTGITIWMDGVNLTMTEVGLQAFQFYLCVNLVTYGPTVWWDTPGFSQATITGVEALDNSGQNFGVTFHLDDGYNSSFLLDPSTGAVNGEYTNPSNGRLQAGPGYSTVSATASPVSGSNNTWKFPLTNSYFSPVIGYKLLARGDFLFCNLVASCNNTVINDYTLLNCAGFGFLSNVNNKTTFKSLSIKPATFPPPNGTQLPVRASSADGVHSSDDYVGPTLDSCLFTALDDDCIAIHGSLNTISSIVNGASGGSSVSSTATTSSCTFPSSIPSSTCAPPPASQATQVPSVVSGQSTYKLLGCLKVDIYDNKVPLDYSSTGGSIVMNNMTVEYCASLAKGDTYFGLTVGVQCMWGDHLTTTGYPAVPANSCNSYCLGDIDESCGAENLLQVYSSNSKDAKFTATTTVTPGAIIPHVKGTASSWTYRGCYQYGFNGNYGNFASETTLESCADHCSGLGAPAMSLRYGAYCYCGYQQDCAPLICDSACSAPCLGNSSEACGSDYYALTYTLDPPASISSSASSKSSTRTATSSASSSSASATAGNTTFIAPSGPAFPGATLQFYSVAGIWNLLGTAQVLSVSGSSPITITVAGSLSALGVDATSSWVNMNQVGSGFLITNTMAGNNRGRGAIVKASNGVISNSFFQGVAYAGIDIGPEFTYWAEAGYVRNVSLINNVVDSCNYLDEATSAVMVHGDGDVPITGNNNVMIQGLRISNTSASNLYIGATTGLSISGVAFSTVFHGGPVLAETWPNAVATFENVSSVSGGKIWGCIVGGIGRTGVVALQLNGNVTGIGPLGSC